MIHLDEVQKKILKIYGWILGLGIGYTIFIYTTGLGIPCFFNKFTGLQCPGCGSTRMFLSAFRGDFQSAFAYNQAAFISFPAWGLISLMAFVGRPAFARNGKFISVCAYVTIVLYCVVDIVRNIV